ncbi:hypothetical protein BKA63DRAFT_62099 [Paraphoma chrysanthemicola]|nr:hypothetical protein BKA63DRAFT_62099 [Paraphoma chrysanthemicola]
MRWESLSCLQQWLAVFYVRRSKSTLRRHHEALAAVSRHLGLTVVPTIQLWLTSWSPMPALQAPQGNERGMTPGSRQPRLLHFTISCNASWSSLLRSSSEVDAAPAPDSRLLSPVHLWCFSAPDDPRCQPLQIVCDSCNIGCQCRMSLARTTLFSLHIHHKICTGGREED